MIIFINRVMLIMQKLLMLKIIRYVVGYTRYFYFRYIKRTLKIYGNKYASHLGKKTFDHNFKNIKHSILIHDRLHHLIYPLLAIVNVSINKAKLKVLSIGPRSEAELLLIAGYGFKFSNIRGIDLFSYSPKIDVGDMHGMPYENNSFDVIFSGWVLAYSDKQENALKEMVRVLRPGGYITFGQGFDKTFGKKHELGGKVRKNYVEEIFNPIKKNIDVFFFKHDITTKMANDGERAILAVLKIKK